MNSSGVHAAIPLAAVLDSLEEQIAVIERSGVIRYVNQSWIQFGVSNGISPNVEWIGSDYLAAVRSETARFDADARLVEEGMRNVLEGKTPTFSFEYPCHSENERRWFVMRIAVLEVPHQDLFVVSHHNITPLKLVEEQLEHVSRHDALTGLANRRHLETFLQNEWQRGMRQRTPLGLIMADLDHFKSFNDRHGHLAGDRCLQRVGKLLMSLARRPGDLAARYGGEEFVLVLGDTNQAQAIEIAEAIRERTLDLDLQCDGKRLTVSLGVVSLVPSSGLPEALIKLADEALYRAKQAGRNRVESG